MFESHNCGDKCFSTSLHSQWLCDATPQSAQWKKKTLSESDMCADCEPDPGECCEISVRDKTRN